MSPRSRDLLLVLAASIPIVALLSGEFIVTDHAEIVDRLMTSGSVTELLSSITGGRTGVPYRPTVFVLHSLTLWVAGESPAAFRAVNAALHVGNALLVFALLKRLGASRESSLGTSCLFAVFPLTATSVAWAGDRTDIAALGGCLGFFLLSHEALRHRKKWAVPAALLCLVAALGAKEVASGSVLVTAGAWILHRRRVRQRLLPLLGAHVATVAWFWLWHTGVAGMSPIVRRQTHGLVEQLALSAHIHVGYLTELLLPHRLRICDSLAGSPTHVELGIFVMVLGGTVWVAISAFRARNALVFLAVLWIWGFGAVTSGIVPLRHVRADRYLYCMLPAALFLVVTAIASLARRLERGRYERWAIMALYVYFVAGLWIRAERVRDDQTLWRYELSRDRDCREGYSHLARRAFIAEQYRDTIAYADAALAPNAGFSYVQRDLTVLYRGVAHQQLAQLPEARSDFDSVQWSTDSRVRAEAAYRLGVLSVEQQKYAEASAFFERALDQGFTDRAAADALIWQAFAQTKLGSLDAARATLRKYRAPTPQPEWHKRLLREMWIITSK